MRVFIEERDYSLFLGLLDETVQEFDIECWGFCLMPNHYHLTLRPSRPNLPEAIHKLNGEFAQSWNRRHEHVGHVFQGRFKDQIVQEDRYLMTLCRYIALNPVRSGLTARPEEWLWSSYAAIAGLRPAPAFLSIDRTLRLFGDDEPTVLQSRYVRYVGRPDGEAALEDRISSNARIVGDRTFRAAILESADERGPDPDLSRA
jgi:putative transposase